MDRKWHRFTPLALLGLFLIVAVSMAQGKIGTRICKDLFQKGRPAATAGFAVVISDELDDRRGHERRLVRDSEPLVYRGRDRQIG